MQRHRLELAGIKDYLDLIVTSEEAHYILSQIRMLLIISLAVQRLDQMRLYSLGMDCSQIS